jgi:hypothetical protein
MVELDYASPVAMDGVVPVLIEPPTYDVREAYIAKLHLRATGVSRLDAIVDLDAGRVVSLFVPPFGGTIESSEWVGKAPPTPPGD